MMSKGIDKEKKDKSTKPFLKWAGGKGQLLETFIGYYPKELAEGEIKHYYEPFVGGGAVFFDIAQKFQIESAFLYDLNPELIITYQVIQKDVEKLITILDKYKNKYEKINSLKQKEFYYEVRQSFNQQRLKINYSSYSERWIRRAAQIIFLNKTCFNGLFRFNSKGEFNTPAGSYKNPKILDEQNLLKVSETLSIAEIRRADFKEVELDLKDDSFIYFDPPYRPLNKTSSFTAYSKNAFNDDDQVALGNLFKKLDSKGVLQMLSNSDPKNSNPGDNFFDDLYNAYNIYRVPARRMINSDATKRNAINEIIVTNYPIN
ncbi:MAG: DNA adenine methylase [Bacteroidota bacterium]